METMGIKMMSVLRTAAGTLWVLIAAAGIGWGLTAEELMVLMEKGETLTLIDVRDKDAFASAHLPDAINIPAHLCRAKSMPPLGRVIVYGDGLRTDLSQACVAHMNEKTGVRAEFLEGGFGRWEALRLPTTGGRGMQTESLPLIAFDQLTDAVAWNPDIVLVDLRRPGRQALGGGGTSPEADLSDLGTVFPGVAVVETPFDLSRVPAAITKSPSADRGTTDHTRIYILIDNADGRAEQTARHMRAAGIRRFLILLGGEEMIKREGRSGLSRLTR